MKRREFLASSLAATSLAVAPGNYAEAAQANTQGKGREFYQLRCYRTFMGPQRRMCDDFFRNALLPALNRLNIRPVGVFELGLSPGLGDQYPAYYVLMPGQSMELLATVEDHLAQDAEYLKAGAAFLNTPMRQPAFERMDSFLMQAFASWPKIVLPPATAANAPRIFELRFYESATDQDYKRKVEELDARESAIFAKYGIREVFYGDILIGSRLPRLVYMVTFDNMADREKKWPVFLSSPEWRAYNGQPRYAFEDIVSKYDVFILKPTPYSQI